MSAPLLPSSFFSFSPRRKTFFPLQQYINVKNIRFKRSLLMRERGKVSRTRIRVETYRRRRKLKEGGTPQGEELGRIHAVQDGVLLLLLHPAHVDDLNGERETSGGEGP